MHSRDSYSKILSWKSNIHFYFSPLSSYQYILTHLLSGITHNNISLPNIIDHTIKLNHEDILKYSIVTSITIRIEIFYQQTKLDKFPIFNFQFFVAFRTFLLLISLFPHPYCMISKECFNKSSLFFQFLLYSISNQVLFHYY